MANIYIDPATYEVGDKVRLRNKTPTKYLTDRNFSTTKIHIIEKCKTIVKETGDYQICWIDGIFFPALELEPADTKMLSQYNEVIEQLKGTVYQKPKKTKRKKDKKTTRKQARSKVGPAAEEVFKSLSLTINPKQS